MIIERILKFNGKATHREIEISGEVTILNIEDFSHPKITEFFKYKNRKFKYFIKNSVIPFGQNTGVRSQIIKNLETHIYVYENKKFSLKERELIKEIAIKYNYSEFEAAKMYCQNKKDFNKVTGMLNMIISLINNFKFKDKHKQN